MSKVVDGNIGDIDAVSVREAVECSSFWTTWLDELPEQSTEDAARLLSSQWGRTITSRIVGLQRRKVDANVSPL